MGDYADMDSGDFPMPIQHALTPDDITNPLIMVIWSHKVWLLYSELKEDILIGEFNHSTWYDKWEHLTSKLSSNERWYECIGTTYDLKYPLQLRRYSS